MDDDEKIDFVRWHVLPKICRALNRYNKNLNTVRSLLDSQRFKEEWLEQRALEFRNKAKRLSDRPLASELKDMAKKIDEVTRISSRRFRQHWSERWVNPLGVTVPFKTMTLPVQERQVDTRFQIQLGIIFRTFTPRDPFERGKRSRAPALRTIARLIVLFLVCADLAVVDDDGEVRLTHNKHRITVGGIYQHLVAAKIGKSVIVEPY